MTEEQWLVCDDPRLMLAYLRAAGRASERKRRLLMCARARSVWEDLIDVRSRAAIEAAEAFADGGLAVDTLREAASGARVAHDDLCDAFLASRREAGGKYRRHVKEAAARADASAVAALAADDNPLGFWGSVTTYDGDPLGFYDYAAVADSLLGRHHGLVHELFGNPFSPVCLDSAWLVWGNGTVARLAQSIYDSQRFEDMPILADALEDAGCGDEKLLGHLREAGPHFRGCWALDLLLCPALAAKSE